MTDTRIDFATATERVAGLLAGVGDTDGPTPCEEFTVAQLLNHFLLLSTAFTGAARGERGPHTETPPGTPPTRLEPNWRRDLEARLRTLADAWRAPEAWTGEATAGGVTMPAEIAGLVALNEVVVHGWDLARATGQPYEIDRPTLKTLTDFAAQDADDQTAREGLYGPVVKTPENATPQAEFIALTGRNPTWTP